ncbi:MAG: hypothetical protein ACE5GK_03655 [Nitrospiria bacterium]
MSLVIILSCLLAFTACGRSKGGGGGAGAVSSSNAINAVNPQVAVDGSGNGIAVWVEEHKLGNTLAYQLTARHYKAGSGGTAQRVTSIATARLFVRPEMAMDAGGNAIVVWRQHDSSIKAIRYDTATDTWGTEQTIGSGDPPDVAVNASGNAVAVWKKGKNSFANRFDATTGTWGTEQQIGSQPVSGGFFSPPAIGIDAAGNAIAVWLQDDGGFSWRLYANRFDAVAGNWGTQTRIESGSLSPSLPEIAMSAAGDAIAVWGNKGMMAMPTVMTRPPGPGGRRQQLSPAASVWVRRRSR